MLMHPFRATRVVSVEHSGPTTPRRCRIVLRDIAVQLHDAARVAALDEAMNRSKAERDRARADAWRLENHLVLRQTQLKRMSAKAAHLEAEIARIRREQTDLLSTRIQLDGKLCRGRAVTVKGFSRIAKCENEAISLRAELDQTVRTRWQLESEVAKLKAFRTAAVVRLASVHFSFSALM